MGKTVLLIGTRKGLFLAESGDRRDWDLRGPLCDGWPIYHAILGEDGTIYAAAASEWLGRRGRGGRVARRRGRAEQGPGGDVGVLGRGPRLRRVERPEGEQGLEPRRRSREDLCRRRVGRALREHGRCADVLAPLDTRRRTGPRGLERPLDAAAGASRALRDHPGRLRPAEAACDR